MATTAEGMTRACSLDELRRDGMRVTSAAGRTVLLIADGDRVAAFDNRCPHMGFPLHRGSVSDGILTCHWHHAKFDLGSGCTFDLFADDAVPHRVEVRDGDVWVDPRPQGGNESEHWLRRMTPALEHNLRLGLAKSALGLAASGAVGEATLRAARFGLANRSRGWSPGLTVLVAATGALDAIDEADRPLALYHGLTHVAQDTAGQAPLFTVGGLPGGGRRRDALGWFRQFVEVREAEAAERALTTAIEELSPAGVAECVFAAATDHRYLDGGHALDHANKAFELLERIGWGHAATVLPSIVPHLTGAARMEESSSWRHPIDVAAMVEDAGRALVSMPEPATPRAWSGHEELAEAVLDGDPAELLEGMLRLVRDGVPPTELSAAVAYAGALRAVHFPTSNELADWETVLHGFTYANAVDRAMRRTRSRLVARGVLGAAIAVWLERFLNVPRRAVPAPGPDAPGRERLLAAFDTHGQVDLVGRLTVDALAHADRAGVIATLGHALLREDATFHQFQMLDAALRQLPNHTAAAGDRILLGAARYLASHYPTPRSSTQTYDIALRLRRGEALHDV